MVILSPQKTRESAVNPSVRQGVQSIRRAVSLLRAVSRFNEQGASLSKIARITDLKLSTAHRILSTLTSEGLIRFDPVSKLYHVGFELFTLGNMANQFTIRGRFRTALEFIAKKTNDTVYLIIREGYDSICIDRVEGSSPLRLVFDIGERRPFLVDAWQHAV